MEYRLAKARVAGSNPVSRSFYLSATLEFTRGADFFCSIGLECQRPAVFRTLVKSHNLRFRFVSSIHLSRGLRLKEVCKILENLLFT